MKQLLTYVLSLFALTAGAQSFDMTKPQPMYNDSIGYGYDVVAAPTDNGVAKNSKSVAPFYFSVKVPDGNYRVTLKLGNKKKAGSTFVRAEARRLVADNCVTKKGELKTVSFLVNKRNVDYVDANGKDAKVRIKPGEVGSMTWDDKLTLEFNGDNPCVSSITVEPVEKATTVFLCGNSTVVDQSREPWASWGQMFPYWFKDDVCIANYGESGLTCSSFMAQMRLEKILSIMKPGDYAICEFGHNDEKEKGPGRGAWYHYTVALKTFVDRVREKGGIVVFCTPTQRRTFDKERQHITNSHGDFPAAMKAVAEREKVPCIDLNAETKVLYETMGYEGCKALLVHYPMGTFPWQEKKFEDNTHFNPFGAYEISRIIATGLKTKDIPLKNSLRDNFVDFDSAKPDAQSSFYWPQSPLFDGKKPDGN